MSPDSLNNVNLGKKEEGEREKDIRKENRKNTENKEKSTLGQGREMHGARKMCCSSSSS